MMIKMTLQKAIEINTDLLSEGPQFPPDDRRDAVKLGIEALKRYIDLRKYNIIPRWEKLPGETLN